MRFSISLIASLLVLALLLFAGCSTTPREGTENDVNFAVQATLTAIAAEYDTDATIDDPEPVHTPVDSGDPASFERTRTPPPAAALDGLVELPPQIADFKPASRPSSSKGDPNALVVIYEWSDYT